jgi:SAM-dependent methyltransferase
MPPDTTHDESPPVAELDEGRLEALREEIRRFVEPSEEARVLDSGAGTGGFAFAVAPLVREVVALDAEPAVLATGQARGSDFPNVSFAEGSVTSLPFADESFDLATSFLTLHHVARPELVVPELVRVTGFRGQVLIVDLIAPTDPLAGFELDRFERARDPSHQRLLPDVDIRSLLDANGLVLRRSQMSQLQREAADTFDLAAAPGEAERALASGGYTATIGWYLAAMPRPAPV